MSSRSTKIKRGRRPFPYGESRRLCCSLEAPDLLKQDNSCVNHKADSGSGGTQNPTGTRKVIEEIRYTLPHIICEIVQTVLSPSIRVLLAVITDSGDARKPCIRREDPCSDSLNSTGTTGGIGHFLFVHHAVGSGQHHDVFHNSTPL